MFDGGVPTSDQFHQFMVAAAAGGGGNSTTSSSSLIPIFFSSINNHGYDSSYSRPRPSCCSDLGHMNHEQVVVDEEEGGGRHDELESKSLMDLWSNDEILALRSTMENNWFPHFSNWEHVSRKLGELGFKRSPEQCKEKFEEQSHHEISLNYNNSNKNYRNIFTELDEFYPSGNQEIEKQNEEEDQKMNLDENSTNPSQELQVVIKSNKKRKRTKLDNKFETFKDFCESVVNKMMSQQEELHNKLIQDILKRDAENIAREEIWKNEELERIKIESEKRAQEQVIAGKRQSIIIEFLKKFTSEKDHNFSHKIDHQIQNIVKLTTQNRVEETSTSSNKATILLAHQNPTPKTPSPPRPSSILTTKKDSIVTTKESKYTQKGDIGMRWPRDQVFALINLRCKLSTNSNNEESNKEGVKGPLWERISQGMLELGYKRSAKRCKEKWENINKYFRKTKDSNKKRSMDSRTCPYFHQLSCLYTEGTVELEASNNVTEKEEE
ncbi:hypothetical protein ACJIZ3_001375 [Penstemon smallii]|uniref:Myb-like domain-containing protein n=1 Tax=Penstemon smallii TaxID=265156 RepID=A0ABD3U4H3_9LAMI